MPFSKPDTAAVARTLSQIAEQADDVADAVFERRGGVERAPEAGPGGGGGRRGLLLSLRGGTLRGPLGRPPPPPLRRRRRGDRRDRGRPVPRPPGSAAGPLPRSRGAGAAYRGRAAP